MKPLLLLPVFLVFSFGCFGQYYLRGQVNDESGKGIYNAKILLSSKGLMPFFSGTSGAFGINLSVPKDSITVIADGYDELHMLADARVFTVCVLQKSADALAMNTKKLLSLIPDREDAYNRFYYQSGETYSALVENSFTETASYPSSGFALDIDRASYSNIRRFLNMGLPVPHDAVRIEEMLNYFDLSDSQQNRSGFFKIGSQITDAPWNHQNQLLFLRFNAPMMNTDTVPPAKLVFLIDCSGSMDQPNRLPLLKEAFKMLVKNMRRQDTVAIMIYGSTVGLYLQPVSCYYKDSINTAIDKLEPGGETPGAAAIRSAFTLAEKIYNSHSNNRIILATDGDFNVGETTEKELEDIVEAHRQSGIYLTCLGVGAGNYKDSKLEAIAKKGNGNFAYIDNIREAEKVLVREFTKTIYTVANDASVDIKFNPLFINRYRLIGFDNNKEMLEDTIAQLEGGEVGSGHNFTAVFEMEPAGYFNDSMLNVLKDVSLAQVTLKYRKPDADMNIHIPYTVKNNYAGLNNVDSSFRFATAVVMFGGLLKQSPLWKNYTWDDVASIAKSATDPASYIETELLSLIQKAKNIYMPGKQRKKSKRGNE